MKFELFIIKFLSSNVKLRQNPRLKPTQCLIASLWPRSSTLSRNRKLQCSLLLRQYRHIGPIVIITYSEQAQVTNYSASYIKILLAYFILLNILYFLFIGSEVDKVETRFAEVNASTSEATTFITCYS